MLVYIVGDIQITISYEQLMSVYIEGTHTILMELYILEGLQHLTTRSSLDFADKN
jgi:hypothetical protein